MDEFTNHPFGSHAFNGREPGLYIGGGPMIPLSFVTRDVQGSKAQARIVPLLNEADKKIFEQTGQLPVIDVMAHRRAKTFKRSFIARSCNFLMKALGII